MKKIGQLGLLTVASVTLAACGTTSVGIGTHGANITYKLDQGIYKQASVTIPYSSRTTQQPTSRPATRPEARTDAGRVDPKLYAHQKVGRPYTIMGKRYTPKHQPYYDEVGTASWYGAKFNGKPTATGETFDMNDITAAHKTLALNSMVHVTNLETGATLMVRVNDRGPFVDGRIIDLSRASAQTLGLFNSGLARVRVQYVGPADPNAAKKSRKRKPQYVAPRALPRPKAEPAPEYVAQAPRYKSLRDLNTPPAAPVAMPQKQMPFIPKAQPFRTLPQNPSPYSRPRAAELPEREPQGNGPVTLTIKGPIHMASSKSDENEKPVFIPAVNYTTLKAADAEK